MKPQSLTEQIKRLARYAGFDLCGIARAEAPAAAVARYRDWVAAGYHGDMDYLARRMEERADPQTILEGARSVICCAISYNTFLPRSIEAPRRDRVWISRYAWGDDYHLVMRRMLEEMAVGIEELLTPQLVKLRACVDTAPLLERTFAREAGLGWIGRNGALINVWFGSYMVLGEILTDLELEPDRPVQNRCGNCRYCMDACPGGAIVQPHVIDARRCASYLTIEQRSEPSEEEREVMGRNVFGCDICQDVCPWNESAPLTREDAFCPRPGLLNPRISKLETLTAGDFDRKFERSPIRRRGYEGLMRNLHIAKENHIAGDI